MQQSVTRWKRNRKFFFFPENAAKLDEKFLKLVFAVIKCAFHDDTLELIFLLKWRRAPTPHPPCLQPMVICSLFFSARWEIEKKRGRTSLKSRRFISGSGTIRRVEDR